MIIRLTELGNLSDRWSVKNSDSIPTGLCVRVRNPNQLKTVSYPGLSGIEIL